MKVCVHVLWITVDLAAIQKMGGLSGSNGRSPCRFCEITGERVQGSNHYYFPTKVKISLPDDGGRLRLKRCYDPERLNMRKPRKISSVLRLLGENSTF